MSNPEKDLIDIQNNNNVLRANLGPSPLDTETHINRGSINENNGDHDRDQTLEAGVRKPTEK